MRWRQENERVVADVQAQLAALTAQTAASNAATSASSAAASAGAPAWLAMAAAIATAAAMLSPFLIALGSAAVILGTFAVAGAATLALLGGLAAGFVAIGAAITYLGSQTMISGTGAKGVDTGALGTLLTNLSAMKTAFEQQAAPLATLVLFFANSFIPIITQAGTTIMAWFGDRLPGILSGFGAILNALTPILGQFGTFIGQVFDKIGATGFGVGGSMNLISSTFVSMVQLIIGAAQGLLANLLALSQWFLERLPTYGPIVKQVFDLLGSAVQGAAGVIGRFADWLVANWPAISANVAAAVQSITDAWNKWAPVVGPLIASMLPALGAAIQSISTHAGIVVPLILGAVLAFVTLATGVATLISWLLQLIYWIASLRTSFYDFLVATATQFATWENQIIGSIRNVISALDRIPGVNIQLPAYTSIGGGAAGRGRGFTGRSGAQYG